MENYGEVLLNEDLKKYNTYKIGGKCKYIIKVNDVNNLIGLIDYLNINNIKYFVLGKGSNVILPDEDYDGAIILLDKINKIKINKNIVEVGAGCTLSYFINRLISKELKGIENLYGIPGTIGAGIVGNVGCYGTTISDYLDSVTYLEDGKLVEIKKDDCYFDYRTSIFKTNKKRIIISCKFIFEHGDKEEMEKTITTNLNKRRDTQPLEYPNAGSVFRNPIGYFAGAIIDSNNLKGYHINDAYISEKHANFIINKGNATSKDIKELIKYIQKFIFEKEKIELELEQEIIKY